MEKNLNLDIDTIFNKEFSIEFKGYSPVEVDQFLDMVAKDYDTYNNVVATLKKEVEFYQSATDNLKARVIELENKLAAAEENNANGPSPVISNLSQVDILRRIARLEQEVFNRK